MITFGYALDYLSNPHKPCEHTDACVAIVVDRAKKLHKALWAVRVPDAVGDWEVNPGPRVHSELSCVFTGLGSPGTCHYGSSPDAARIEAAKAILTTLSAELREELGECP